MQITTPQDRSSFLFLSYPEFEVGVNHRMDDTILLIWTKIWQEQCWPRLFQTQTVIVPFIAEPLTLLEKLKEKMQVNDKGPCLSCHARPISVNCCHRHQCYQQRGMDQLACAENLANNIHSPVSAFPFILVTVNAGVSLHVLHSFIYDLFIQQMEQLQTWRPDMATSLSGSLGCRETGNRYTNRWF